MAAVALQAPEDPLLQRVLNALSFNRSPGFHFAGHFLRLSFDQMATDDCRVSMDMGPHNRDAMGMVHPVALGIFADLALAATVRSGIPGNWRLATVNMQLQLTGRPVGDSLTAQGRFEGAVGLTGATQALGTTRLLSGGELIALGTATFMVMPAPAGLQITPMLPWPSAREAEMLVPDELTPTELATYQAAVEARARTACFPDAFWGLRERPHTGGGWCRLTSSPHVSNRVGHVQGGVLVGQALSAARTAAPVGWRVSHLSLNFLSPGMAPGTLAHARLLHRGRSTAVARVETRGRDRRHLVETQATLVPESV